MVSRRLLALVLAAAMVGLGRAAAPVATGDTPPAARTRVRLPVQDEITIAVTDSGLGGLSIMAEIAARAKQDRVARRVHLVFFNALFSNDSGYNSLRSRAEKLRVFDRALRSLEQTVRPDVIVIGCNTLSVIYPGTEFARSSRLPVAEIIGTGVELFLRELRRQPAARLVLFGTDTTIGEESHRKALLAAGIPGDRIMGRACGELAGYIEKNWQGDETALLVSSFVGEAAVALPAPKAPVFAGLVCTHYGYAAEAWQSAFKEQGQPLAGVLNPNQALAAELFEGAVIGRVPECVADARVISMVEISAEKRSSLGTWLGRVSPEVAAALAKYEWRPDLFEWQSLVGPQGKP